MKRFTGVKEEVVCVKLSPSEGQNLMFTQANVSCWLTEANPLLPRLPLQLLSVSASPGSAMRMLEPRVPLQASEGDPGKTHCPLSSGLNFAS